MGHFKKFYIRSLFFLLLFFGMIHFSSITSHAVQYVSHPISFSGSEYIELSDGSDDPVVQEEYNHMMRSTGSSNVSMGSRAYYALMSYTTPAFTLATGLNADDVYEVQLSFNYSLTPSPTQSDSSLRFRNCHAAFASLLLNSYSNNTLPYSFSGSKTYYLSGSTIMASNTCLIRTFVTASNALSFSMNVNFNIQVDSIKLVSGDADAAYQQGYNAGYSSGQSAGYNSGYSAGVSSVDTQSYYNKGYNVGYNQGYNKGQADINTDAIYDQGYSEGLDEGYENGQADGYNSGYSAGVVDGKASVDTQSYYDMGYNEGYDEGIDVGKASVDTQSYYDAGFSAGVAEGTNEGYNQGYAAGVQSGYDEGYAAGVKAASGSSSGSSLVGSQPTLDLYYDDNKLGVGVSGPEIQSHLISTVEDRNVIYLKPLYHVSGFTYYKDVIYQGSFDTYLDLYFPKEYYDINDLATFYWDPFLYDLEVFSPSGERLGYDVSHIVEDRSDEYKLRINITVYMNGSYYGSDVYIRPVIEFSSTGTNSFATIEYAGAVTDNKIFIRAQDNKVENSIANQTNELTNGYDDGSGNSMNQDFSSELDSFHDQEYSLFTSVQSGLDDFEYFDFNSAPAMLSGISFVSSIMTGWFNAAGGVSGVGIVLSILFSIIIASMALGLYKWYQSRGK